MRLIILFALAALLFGTPASSAEPSLTEKEAKAFIENRWNDLRFKIKLGSMKVIGGFAEGAKDFDVTKNEIPSRFYKTIQAYEKVGIIKISEGEFKAIGPRAVKEILITKTDAGEKLAKKGGFPQEDGWLVIRQGIFRVDRVVKNEARQKGIDNYRIIMATYAAEWTPEFKRAAEMTGPKLSEERKVIMLIKFDSFSSSWKHVTSDLANRDEDFRTNNVATTLDPFSKQ